MKKAFTLAEILIVVAIIGLVAEMTIPILVQDIKTKVAVAKVKKAHAFLESAFQLAVLENGPPDTWGDNPSLIAPDGEVLVTGAEKAFQAFLPHLRVHQVCEKGYDCLLGLTQHSLDGTDRDQIGPFSFVNSAILADGSWLTFQWVYSTDCNFDVGDTLALQNVCGEIAIIFNPTNKKTFQGKDMFFFYLTKYGVVPMGTATDKHFPFTQNCNNNSKGTLNGYGCTAWIIQNENMDYLKCDNLSWDGKKTCID